MFVIFSASGDAKSAQHSAFFLDPIFNWLLPGISAVQREWVVLAIRKLAHLAEYAILAALVWRALRCWTAAAQGWRTSHALIVMAVVVVYAVTDELHQTFIPNRQGSPIDVAIDTLGGALALSLIWLYGRLRKQ
jgi:VanZ family protein